MVATINKKKSIHRLALSFFLSGEVLYRSTPDLVHLTCIDAVQPAKLTEPIHASIFSMHMH